MKVYIGIDMCSLRPDTVVWHLRWWPHENESDSGCYRLRYDEDIVIRNMEDMNYLKSIYALYMMLATPKQSCVAPKMVDARE